MAHKHVFGIHALILLAICVTAQAQEEWSWVQPAESLDAELLLREGQRLYWIDSLQQAREYFEAVVEIDATNEAAYVWLGFAHWYLGEDSAAEDAAFHAAALNADDADPDVILGMIAYRAGNLARSDSAFSDAVRKGAENPDIYFRWYKTASALGLQVSALARLEKAITLAPDNTILLRTAVREYIDRQSYERAELYARRGAATEQSAGEFTHMLGYSLCLQSRWGEAAIALRRAFVAGYSPVHTIVCLTIASEQRCEFADAARYRDAAQEADIPEETFLFWRGWYHMQFGVYDKAIDELSRSLVCRDTLDTYEYLVYSFIMADREDDGCALLHRLERSVRYRDDEEARTRVVLWRRYLPCIAPTDEISENGMACLR